MHATITSAPSPKFWYASHIGETFEIINTAHGRFKLRTTFGDYWVEKRDCLAGDYTWATISETSKTLPGMTVMILKRSGDMVFCKWHNSVSGRFGFVTVNKSAIILCDTDMRLSHAEEILLDNGLTNPDMIS